jgi:negative regulator of sigma E activity
MKYAYLTLMAVAAMAVAAHAQGTKVYKCPGNSYTNSEAEAKAKGCKPMDGGNITVVEGTRVNASGVTKIATAPQMSTSGTRVDANEQRTRENDARAILEAELKKAEARQTDLTR